MPRECPNCSQTLTRTRRQSWMRRIPGSKYYVCPKCFKAYLLIFGLWLLRWKQYSQKKAIP